MKKLEPIRSSATTDLKQMLLAISAQCPDNIVCSEKDANGVVQTWTYNQLLNDMNAIGTGLFNGLKLKNRKVAIIGPNSYNWLRSFWSVVGAQNGTVMPIDYALTEPEIENNIKAGNVRDITNPKSTDDNSTIDAIICADDKASVIQRIVARNNLNILVIPMSQLDDIRTIGQKSINEGDTSYLDAKIDPEHAAFMFYTSGTSADSKCVKLSHRTEASNLDHANSLFDVGPNDILVNISPFHHIYGIMIMLLMLNVGARICNTNIQDLPRDVRMFKPTFLNFVPRILLFFKKIVKRYLEKNGKFEEFQRLMEATNLSAEELQIKNELIQEVNTKVFGGNLRMTLCAAAPLDAENAEFLKDLNLDFQEVYGATETGAIVSGSLACVGVEGNVGLPFEGYGPKIKIVNPDADGVGEITVSGKGIMQGYYNNPEATAEALITDENGEVWYHTGDLGKMELLLNSGYGKLPVLTIVGRLKDVIVTKDGKKIPPEEIESKLNTNDLILQSMIEYLEDEVAVTIVLDQKMMTALEIEVEQAMEQVRSVIALLNAELPDYKRISLNKIKFSTEPFPITTTGKLKRNAVMYKRLTKAEA